MTQNRRKFTWSLKICLSSQLWTLSIGECKSLWIKNDLNYTSHQAFSDLAIPVHYILILTDVQTSFTARIALSTSPKILFVNYGQNLKSAPKTWGQHNTSRNWQLLFFDALGISYLAHGSFSYGKEHGCFWKAENNVLYDQHPSVCPPS